MAHSLEYSPQGTVIPLAIPRDLLDALDAWVAGHPEARATRSEAIRQLLQHALRA